MSRICLRQHLIPGPIIIYLLLILGFAAASGIGQPQLLLDSGDDSPQCDLDCSSAEKKLVCGTDGRTYDSECDISRANCEGHLVRLKYAGECSDASRCLVERAHAQEMARKPAAGIFIPDCHPDGTYVDVQCHIGTGYCWCVTTQGKPIPGSSARYKRPNCISYQTANSHKRTSRGKKPRRSCSITDREEFNRNMIKIFESEYNRTLEAKNGSSTLPLALRATNWKFTLLDISKNGQLSKSELRDLRRMVKKIIRPRPCARTFTQYCDLDQNKNITRQEWAVCMGVDNTELGSLIALSAMEHGAEGPRPTMPARTRTTGTPSTRRRPPPLLAGPISSPHPSSLTYSPVDAKSAYRPTSWRDELKILSSSTSAESGLSAESRPMESAERTRDPTKKRTPNCSAERSKALVKQSRQPGAGIYVPNCDQSGSYANVQCHSATGFCWCVHPENGKPIPQTSTHNSQPNCNLPAARPLRGCPAYRKETFIGHLTTVLMDEMVASFIGAGNRTSAPPVPDFRPSKDDALKWKFQTLDANQNAYIERSEWKNFKQYMATDERLEKCGRGFFKYCDRDDNRRITVTEWLQCASVYTDKQRKLPVSMKRSGVNPLTTYLKAD
ncbi:putative SPARC-related modular calcium-binding protein 2 [Hypsibius exemplaris]|uniref:SPARC-related modular calcium-binding protein 2 n=1 Tax=Hypsibius exemplaris TaxID=2072580 RepID=A0A1W0WY33_HYPEX|nr:putative SPARC-related modular calcium-binding protein 2 [Hypsibius exemplaris]